MAYEYDLHLMGKNEIVWMYSDSHTTIENVFRNRMNKARTDYLSSSQRARIQFEEYMDLKKERNDYKNEYFKNLFKWTKNSYIKSANEVKRKKRIYKYYQIQYDKICNRLPDELLYMNIGCGDD